MSHRFVRTMIAAGVTACASLGAAHDARATLGGDVASIASNTQALAATRQVDKRAVGERHELVLPSGLVVHEYVSPSGAVYAITWKGPRTPDLRELLGTYFAQLANRPTTGGHNQLNLTGADFVIHAKGHARFVTGRAWVPSLVPAGVTIDASID